MQEHTMSCPYPEGCSCGASEWNLMESSLNQYKNYVEFLEKENEKLIEAIEERMRSLKTYINQDELNLLQHYKTEILSGIEAKKRMKLFLKNVPVGKYDSNRKEYDQKY